MRRQMLLLYFIYCAIAARAQNFSITAHITGFPDNTTFYLDDPDEDSPLDSVTILNNSFTLKGKLALIPQLFWLRTEYRGKRYWCTILMGNEDVVIRGDKKDFPYYLTITGSKIQEVRNKLSIQTRSYSKLRDSLVALVAPMAFDTSSEAKKKTKIINTQIKAVDSIRRPIELEFIKSNINTHAAIFELAYKTRYFSKDSLQFMYDGINEELKKSKYAHKIYNYIKVGEAVRVGRSFSDFEALDPLENTNKLSQYKGKYILLDFTETYCAPCVKAVEELKKIFAENPDKLMIISFCTDKSKDTWMKGMQRDNTNWLNLWDGKGQDSETVLKYDVSGYPTFFLINPQGIVVSVNKGYRNGSLMKMISEKMK